MRKEYNNNQAVHNDHLFFDNLTEISADEAAVPFSLQTMLRAAAQQMIQAALEMEVAEILQRAKYEKTTNSAGFRGYRNAHHQQRTVSTTVGALQVKVARVREAAPAFESSLVKLRWLNRRFFRIFGADLEFGTNLSQFLS